MKKNLLIMSALTVAMLQLGCTTPRGPVAPAAVAKLDRPACKNNNDCSFPVYVSVADDGSCRVQLPFETVTITKGKNPNIDWNLELMDTGDPNRYRFDPVSGVIIVGNDPTLDFDHGGPQGDKKFRWKSVNKRAKTFDYTVAVQRRPDPQTPWANCTTLDPRIVNQGL